PCLLIGEIRRQSESLADTRGSEPRHEREVVFFSMAQTTRSRRGCFRLDEDGGAKWTHYALKNVSYAPLGSAALRGGSPFGEPPCRMWRLVHRRRSGWRNTSVEARVSRRKRSRTAEISALAGRLNGGR